MRKLFRRVFKREKPRKMGDVEEVKTVDSEEVPTPLPMLVTYSEFLKGRDHVYPLNSKLKLNMERLLEKINMIRREYGKPFIITSGYRPGHYNEEAGGSPDSAHITCEAIDIKDVDRAITNWILENDILRKYDLYMENPQATPTWIHLTTRPPHSGSRIFNP